MAVKLITSNTLRGADEGLFALIKEENDFRSPIIIIVPDQYTQAVEKELFSALGIKCSFNIEVLSFYRLAKKFMPRGKTELNQQTAVLLLSKIIKSNAVKLKSYSSVASRRNFANEMYAVITSIRNNCISAEEMQSAVEGVAGKAGDRYGDIALIYGEYMKTLYSDYSDISVLLDSFVKAIPNIAELKSTSIYLTGFSGMTKNKRSIIDSLIANAGNFTMGICDINEQENGRLMPEDVKALMLLNEIHGGSKIYRQDNFIASEQCHGLRQIFSYTLTKFDSENSFYSSYCARNKDEEIRFIVQRIRAMIVAGARYRDIAVVGENISSYSGLIVKYFRDYNIPYFMDNKVTAVKLPKYKFLQAIYAVLKNGMSQGDVINLVKERLFDASDLAKNSFENYLLKYSIGYTKFAHPFTYGTAEEIVQFEYVRQTLIRYIQLVEGDQDNIIIQLGKIKNLFLVLDGTDSKHYILHEDKFAKEFIDVGNSKIDVLFDQMSLMLKDSKLSMTDCMELLLDTMSSIKISLAPINIDCLFVGEVGASRLEAVDTLFLIGAKEDSYPALSSDSGILRDRDIQVLKERGVDFEGGLADKTKSAKYEILQLLSRAKKSVVITCPTTNGGKSNLINQLNTIFNLGNNLVEVNVSPRDSIADIATKIGTKYNFRNHIGGLVKNFAKGNLVKIVPYVYAECDRDRVEKMIASTADNYLAHGGKVCFRNNFLKISGIEEFYRCPFAYYSGMMLKLNERENGEIKVNSMGSFIHRVLEKYFREGHYNRYLLGADVAKISQELVDAVLNESDFAIFKAQDDSGKLAEYLSMRCAFIIKEINTMLTRSKFQPKYFEFSFGMDTAATAIDIPVGEQIYKVRGYIDRVDVLDDIALLIDYKSSDKELDMPKVFCGEKLQLVLYLDAIMAEGYKRCGGLYYFGLPYKYNREENYQANRYSFNGFINSDEQLMRMQDSNYDNGAKSHLPIKYKKKGDTFTPLDAFEAKLSDRDFKQLRNYVKKLLSRTVKVIEDGFIQPLPIEGGCKYCKYSELCRVQDFAAVTRHGEDVIWERANGEDNLE